MMIKPKDFFSALDEMAIPLSILLFLFLIFLFLYLSNTWPDLSGNLTAELLGAIVIVIVLDIAIKARDRHSFNNGRVVAFRSIRIPINKHLAVLFDMYRASLSEHHDDGIKNTTVQEFFNEQYWKSIIQLNVSTAAPTVPTTSWKNYLQLAFNQFNDALNDLLSKFPNYLSSDDIDLIENLINNNYCQYLTVFAIYEDGQCLLFEKDGGDRPFVSDENRDSFYSAVKKYHIDLVKFINNLNETLKSSNGEQILVHEHWGPGIWKRGFSEKEKTILKLT